MDVESANIVTRLLWVTNVIADAMICFREDTDIYEDLKRGREILKKLLEELARQPLPSEIKGIGEEPPKGSVDEG